MNVKRAIALACLASTAMTATAAYADDWTDKWIVRGGFSTVDPKSRNLQLNPTTEVAVDKKTSFTFDVTYLFTENWGLELLAAYPFEHDIDLRTISGPRTPFGSVEHLPPTLSLQYHMNPNGKFRPYVGVGLNYTLFSSEEPDGLSLDDSFGLAIGGGIDLMLGRHALLNFSVKRIDIDADAKLNGADIGTVEIDPMVYGVNFGWRFGRANAAPVAAAAPVVAAPAPAPAPPPPLPPADSDGDGVPDSRDACPNTPPGTRVGPMGCDCDVSVQLQFKFDSAELTDGDIKILEGTAENLRRLNWIGGVAEGHTDSIGTEEFNQGLSERRAQSVIDFLASKGIGEGRIRAVGFGEMKPIADNATAEGRAQNRRVVLRRTDCDEVK